ncbi:hypothetical protein E2P81_ATG09581 [Venturia nashicola]|uniref:Uncharacterized protein n=1 Tax=Venturia nashicola TaxID=86259 RepID=A0A4Z1NUI3_9PEZI|nr:hypothetical protein E6O75_ATG09791 [Venturia nashicola]TLD25924.1 hypothetical protein E2P81_ATG09581 [Venturia nashicola]
MDYSVYNLIDEDIDLPLSHSAHPLKALPDYTTLPPSSQEILQKWTVPRLQKVMDFAIFNHLHDSSQHEDDAKCAAANRIEELRVKNARLESELGYVKETIRSAKNIVWQEGFPKSSDEETF